MNRILGVLSVATLLVACGGSGTNKKLDLSTTGDIKGGGGDATVTPGKNDGEACSTNSQCLGGKCDKTKAGTAGYCTHDCKVDMDCPGGGIAVNYSDGSCQCQSACSKAGDCRTGLDCVVLNDGTTGVCDGPGGQSDCDPTTGTGSCTTVSGYIWTAGLPGACLPIQSVFDATGAAHWQGLCLPGCAPGDTAGCEFVSQDKTAGGQCALEDFTKETDTTTKANLGFKFKGAICDFITIADATVASGGACGGSTQTTTCIDGTTCDPVATTGQKCQDLCTYKAAGDAGTAVGCTGGKTCVDVLSLGASATFPVGVCKAP